ncbi:substrate-binding periplasmic protein [Atopomonas sediminilitoris]|uniref:substrate-binding periplasmic protein n=1 Tax=Atopomonas sediminilitoris TaxID=2919919 RepID=UPI001F4F0445|nr:transporter substrate-binding domain-containing protein [Atopomonas sediminilitoris]MCJ8169596.1 transporter substrate-binding domain-containing protein [Atopomonas sediminilitoris]
MPRLFTAAALSLLLVSTSFAEVLTFAFAEGEPPISDMLNGEVVGLIPELATLAVNQTGDLQMHARALPWARAQHEVELGRLDALLTYPSKTRQVYAVFTPTPAYHLDFGYLVFHRDNPHRAQIESANSFADLHGLTFVAQQGVGFEEQNVPSSVQRIYAHQLDAVLHLLLKRRVGDFAIMQPEQAVYLAQSFGYAQALAFQRAPFIPDAQIPFHIGISRLHPQAEQLIERLEKTLNSPAFTHARDALVKRYR